MQLDEGIELVIAADVARRLGVSKQRVGVLAKQSGFPNSIGVLGRSNVWRWSSIENWAIETGRLTSPLTRRSGSRPTSDTSDHP